MDRKPLSATLKGGIVLFAVAAVADFSYHLLSTGIRDSLNPLWGPNAVNAHVLLMIAMSVVLLGVIQHGVRLRPHAEPSPLVYRGRAHADIRRSKRSEEMHDAYR
jgi:hypothetical protein